MAAQRDRKRKELLGQPDRETTAATEKAKIKSKRALASGRVKETTRIKSDEAWAKAQEALRTAQAKVKHERQARAKAEKALAEAQEVLAAVRLKDEYQARIRRVSFVVRLMIDERGQPQRTEIEEVASSKKQNFLGLDSERIIAFMKECASPAINPELDIPAAPSSKKIKHPIPGPLNPNSSLIVSEVRVFHPHDPDFMTLVLTRDEPFGIKAFFQLQGPNAQLPTFDTSAFEVKVYVNEVSSGKCKLLITYSAKLIQNVLEYIVPMEMPGLSPGLYRLFTIVTLYTPIKLAGFYGKTIIHIV